MTVVSVIIKAPVMHALLSAEVHPGILLHQMTIVTMAETIMAAGASRGGIGGKKTAQTSIWSLTDIPATGRIARTSTVPATAGMSHPAGTVTTSDSRDDESSWRESSRHDESIRAGHQGRRLPNAARPKSDGEAATKKQLEEKLMRQIPGYASMSAAQQLKARTRAMLQQNRQQVDFTEALPISEGNLVLSSVLQKHMLGNGFTY